MFCGEGKANEKIRAFTDIEMSLIEKFVSLCLNMLQEPWEKMCWRSTPLWIPWKPAVNTGDLSDRYGALIMLNVKRDEILMTDDFLSSVL